MQTPKEYKENLKNSIITASMIEDVLFSYNKRAKNWRNQMRKYRQIRRDNYYWVDKYGYEDKVEEKMKQLYKKKSDVLSMCPSQLKAIHKVVHSRRIRIEDTEDEYEIYAEAIKAYRKGEKSEVVYMNSYYDRDYDDYVTFINVIVDVPEYYLYYEFDKHSFHSPIDEKDIHRYQSAEIVQLDDLNTFGENIKDLLPLPFCDKVWNFLMKQKNIAV